MRLEKIVLNGFKSFADKTEFRFDSPITAIVGPNGCGKSNVVDAVKWVLGEQSAKSLRSGQMADVIFGGSSSRKAAGSAEVSLFIANTTGKLPIEADEVQISRTVYKSGESEYRVNNKLCRLKDIRELFMDTGIGAKAYSIIEQGQVEQLLTSSKIDRRALFEEAAGISKYKAHKKEALRKLDRTEQNLLRLADILGEVQKQLRSIKYQAGKARNYLEYSKKLKDLQVNYSLAEFDRITRQVAEKTQALGKTEEGFAVIAAEIAKNDAAMSEMGQRIIQTENQINQSDNSLVSVQSKIEQHMQRIDFLRSRITELKQRQESASGHVERLAEQKRSFDLDLRQYRQEQVNCEKMLLEKGEAAEELAAAIQQINAECASLEAQLEDEKSGVIDIVRRTAQLHNEVQSITVYRSNLSNQKQRLAGRARTSREELEKLLTEKAQQRARLADIEKVMAELEESLEAKREKRNEITALTEQDSKRLGNSKEAKSALSSELAVLQDMENRREGLNNAIKTILRESSAASGRFDYVSGLVADIISADVEHATAVEAALEGATDTIVVTKASKLLEDKETIEQLDGRVDFLCADKIEPFVEKSDFSHLPFVKGRVVEFVKYDGKYAPLVWKLLGKTMIVDSISDAVELAGQTKGYNFVTLDGQFLNGSGIIKLGPLGKASGLISRKSRLRQLETTLGNITSQIVEIQQQLGRNRQTDEHLSKLCKDLRTAIYEANTEKMQVDSTLRVAEESIKRLTEEQPLITGEIELLEEQIAQSVEKEYNSKQKLDELEVVNTQRTERIEQLETRCADSKVKQQLDADRFTDLKVALGQITEQNKALQQTISSMEGQLRENASASQAARTEVLNCTTQSEEAQRDILKSEAAVSELFVEKETNQQNSRRLHSEVEELIEQQKITEQQVRQGRNKQSEIEQKINQLKIELGQLQVKNEDLTERVRDELQIELSEAYQSYEQEQVDWQEVREEMTGLRGKIERLGNVNIDAIDQQEDLERRNEFLSTQVEDLNSSKHQLMQLINRLNKKSREKFAETFEQIRGHFQELFRKLFGGGKADILLEDAEDILDAGIEIVARPPGKETRSISLLSGGEKTMTAIALLFAVFKSKPSPFCLLDEVDAALDEANNERFNLLINEFKKNSQFIIITHSKRTMSIGDVLYGVTMQTRGVSKKISVKFGEIPEPESEPAAVA